LDIFFKNSHLRSICEDHKIAKDLLGEAPARRLKTILTDLYVFDHINQLPPYLIVKTFELENTDIVNIGYDLTWYVQFKANHVDRRLDQHQKFDWTQVKRLQLLSIGEIYG
jgi:hypothetical protein